MNWVVASVPYVGDLESVKSFATHMPSKFPINGQWMSFIAMVTAAGLYWIVSLLTCREDFNMDQMLHRGQYALDPKAAAAVTAAVPKGFTLRKFLGIDHQYSRGDKVISYSLFTWKMFWLAVGAIITLWNLVNIWPFERWPLSWWSNYWRITSIYIPFVLAIPTTLWFLWGGIRDMRLLFRDLRGVTRHVHDDGTVVGHRNLDEVEAEHVAKSGRKVPPSARSIQ